MFHLCVDVGSRALHPIFTSMTIKTTATATAAVAGISKAKNADRFETFHGYPATDPKDQKMDQASFGFFPRTSRRRRSPATVIGPEWPSRAESSHPRASVNTCALSLASTAVRSFHLATHTPTNVRVQFVTFSFRSNNTRRL